MLNITQVIQRTSYCMHVVQAKVVRYMKIRNFIQCTFSFHVMRIFETCLPTASGQQDRHGMLPLSIV